MSLPNPRQYAIDLVTFVRSLSESFIKDWPEGKWTYQPSPTDNHPLWVMGHIASTDAWLGGVLSIPGTEVPETYQALFGHGSKPQPMPSAYPAPLDVRAVFARTHAAKMRWLESASDAQLGIDLREKTGKFASDGLDAFLKMAWHEGWHFGQVANVRKALGLPLIMG